MIRARDDDEEVLCVKKPRLGDRVRMPAKRLECSHCEGNLSRGYSYLSCHHQLCEDCTKKIMEDGKIRCPMCRSYTSTVQQLPLLDEILLDAPRKLKCGEIVEGWVGEEAHKECFKCVLMQMEEVNEENRAVKLTNTHLLTELDAHHTRIEVLQSNTRHMLNRRSRLDRKAREAVDAYNEIKDALKRMPQDVQDRVPVRYLNLVDSDDDDDDDSDDTVV